jgi:hypothetical protein
MAILEGGLAFTGSMKNISAYRMKGVSKLVLRSKGGASRQKIQQDAAFALTRLNNEEWSACTKAGKNIRLAMYAVKHLANYNISGPLNALCKIIQADDGVNEKGKRQVQLSKSSYKLEGFGLNTINTFDAVLRHPIVCNLNRDTATAGILLPDILPGINFHNPQKQPLYRFVFILGAAPDIVYDDAKKMYVPAIPQLPHAAVVHTTWCNWKQRSEATQLSLALTGWNANSKAALLLSVGVEFGVPVSNTEVKYVKYSGCAKILKVA